MLLVKFHHSLADGMGLIGLCASLQDEYYHDQLYEFAPKLNWCQWIGMVLSLPYTVVRQLVNVLFMMRTSDNALTLPPGKQLSGVKHGYIHEDWDVGELKAAAKKHQASFNDFIMAMISVAVHRYFETRGRAESRICISVPVSMRKTHKKVEDLNLMNDVAPLVFEFDLHGDFEQALSLVKATTSAIRNSYISYATYFGAKVMGLLPMILVLPVSNYISKRVTIVFSNVAGPKRPLVYDGFKCKKLAFLLPALGEISCGLSLISIDNKLKVGLLTDRNILEEPAELIQLLDCVRREVLNIYN